MPVAAFDADLPLQSAPIDPSWITAGTPQASNRVLATATDGASWTMLWACTAGSFRWRYRFDETIHFLDGAVSITAEDGVTRHYTAGDMIFFPAGSVADWRIESHVKKLAFCHTPAPSLMRPPLKLLRRLGKLSRAALALLKTQLSDSGLAERAEQDEKSGRGAAPVSRRV